MGSSFFGFAGELSSWVIVVTSINQSTFSLPDKWKSLVPEKKVQIAQQHRTSK